MRKCLGYWAVLAWALAFGAAAAHASVARDAAALIDAEADGTRIIVLGELHGTHEAPALAGELLRTRSIEGRPLTLALEVHVGEQARIDAYVASDGDEAARHALLAGPFWAMLPERSDGRRSVAMLALIDTARRLRAEGMDLRVLATDAGNAGGGAAERNRRMAAVLRSAFDREADRDFVVLIGNYHARRAAPSTVGGLSPGQSLPVPTMAHLTDVPMLRINVSAERGAFWACVAGTCGPQRLGGQSARPLASGDVSPGDALGTPSKPRFRRTPHDAARWDAQLVVPSFSAAEPVAPPHT